MAEQEDKKKPTLTPEQEAEAAAKKAARAEAKAKGGGKGGKKGAGAGLEVSMERVKRSGPPRLRTVYEKEIRAKLLQELGLGNVMQVPRLAKITINMGLGEAV